MRSPARSQRAFRVPVGRKKTCDGNAANHSRVILQLEFPEADEIGVGGGLRTRWRLLSRQRIFCAGEMIDATAAFEFEHISLELRGDIEWRCAAAKRRRRVGLA